MTDETRAGTVYGWLRAEPRRFDLAVALGVVAVAAVLIVGSPEDFDSGWPEVAAGIGAFLLIFFRRSRPFPLLAIALCWTVLHVAILERPSPTIFATLVLLATACVRLDRRSAIFLGVGVAISLYAAALTTTEFQYADERAVISIVWTMGVVGIADATRSWRQFRAASEAQLRSTVLAADAQAKQQVSEERLTIARELHDLLAHNLSVMNVQTGAALHLLRDNPDQAETSLVAARDAGRGVLDELRDLLTVLRHEGDDASPMAALPSVGQLGGLVETMRSTGLEVTWTDSGEPTDLTPAVSLAAYRIAQEALTNAAKHGDGRVELHTTWDESGLSIHIENATGLESSPAGSGLGLIGMEERATANGGRFDATSTNDRFRVAVWLPAPSREMDISS